MENFNHISTQHNLYDHEYKTLCTGITVNTKLGPKIQKSPNPNATLNAFILKQNATAIYTDGSKVTNSLYTGSSCFCPDLSITTKISISKFASVFTAECIGISTTLDIAIANPNRNYLILTDSLSALQSLESTKVSIRNNMYIFEIKKKFNRFLENSPKHDIKFIWIPSHIGLYGNETADKLAKEATNTCPTNDFFKIPYTDLYEIFRKTANEQTKQYINQKALTSGKKFFELYHYKKCKPWFAGKTLSRKCITTINRCRSNHYNLGASLAKVNIIKDPKCTCGYEMQDLNHILWQYTNYDRERKSLINNLIRAKLQLPLNIETLIKTSNANM